MKDPLRCFRILWQPHLLHQTNGPVCHSWWPLTCTYLSPSSKTTRPRATGWPTHSNGFFSRAAAALLLIRMAVCHCAQATSISRLSAAALFLLRMAVCHSAQPDDGDETCRNCPSGWVQPASAKTSF